MAHYKRLHDWDLTPPQAIALQKELRARVHLEPLSKPVETIAGADISFNKYSETVYAGIVVLRLPSLEVVEEAGVTSTARFPYIPGLLSFREIPALLEAWTKLKTEPDVIMCDGQGLAHPRRMGIACHVGLLTGRPSFGCAKSVLVGKFTDPPLQRGSQSPMIDRGETIGAALRTKNKVQPVYVSPGHLLTLEDAVALTLACDGGYRIPEPTRRAHNFVNKLRQGEGTGTLFND